MLRRFRHTLEGILILFAVLFFRLLPLDMVSLLAGVVTRIVGPFLRAHNTADINLERAMPELSEKQRRRILGDMWDNLGRTIAEYPHLARTAMARRITIEGREHLEKILEMGKGAVIVSGHFANWEIAPRATSLCGLPPVVIYRKANNHVAEWLTRKVRAHYTRGLYQKGRAGAVQSIKALKEGHALALLIDQKMNDGSPMAFFGRTAMTATAAARLAIKFQLPILAGRVVRKNGVHFTLVIEPLIFYPANADPLQATAELTQLVERWVREQPGQWFWVHKRWGKII